MTSHAAHRPPLADMHPAYNCGIDDPPPFHRWELVCVAQKLILVGFLVLNPFNPGSFSQLVLGLFIALLFAVVQMQVQPYKRRTDNFLATASNVSLFSFFICAALYRVVELTSEFDAVSAQLTGEWASRRFTVSFQFISAVMLISLFGGLILMVVLHLIELFVPRNEEVFRWALNSSEVVPPTLKAGQFHTFLSHNWASGQECVQHKRRTSLVCVLWPSI